MRCSLLEKFLLSFENILHLYYDRRMKIAPYFLADSCYLRIPKQLLNYFEDMAQAKVTNKTKFKIDVD